ncbi:MAG: serine/threonine-protein kinase [Gemmatimonadaceae bacterium]
MVSILARTRWARTLKRANVSPRKPSPRGRPDIFSAYVRHRKDGRDGSGLSRWERRTWLRSPISRVRRVLNDTANSSSHVAAAPSGIPESDATGTAQIPESVPVSPRDRWEAVGEKPLAQRGQGAVWRVRDLENPTGDLYALKEMRYRKGPMSLAYRRFIREINVMTALSGSHLGIVPVIAQGIPTEGEAWLPFYVMPLAAGSLERARDLTGALEPVLRIGIQIAEALEVAHGQGITHRDVKPGNVLLFGDERRPALADFGICHLEDEERLTGTDAQTVGSRDYVAPELLGGGPRDAVSTRVDIYSLGKTLYAVAAGRDPFPRESHLDEEWNLAPRFDDPRFEHLHGLLQRMVALDPNARFATMRECGDAMERALENVQQGRAYHAGMYGGDRVPLERYSAGLALLRRANGREREDAQVALVDESERIAREIVTRTTPGGQDVAYARGLQPDDSEVAETCANHLLVPGLVGVVLGIDELLEEWWARVRHLALPAEFRTRRDVLLAEAAAGAAYAMAAVAWQRRRWEVLRDIVGTIAQHRHPFVYMDIGEGYAPKSIGWVSRLMRESELLRNIESSVAENPDFAIGIVTGLAVLRDLIDTADDVLKTLVDPGTQIDGSDYAALYPDYREWTTDLADASARIPAVARGIAMVLGASSPDQLQQLLQRVTPALRRWTAQIASGVRRDAFWLQQFGKQGVWARWIGVEKG